MILSFTTNQPGGKSIFLFLIIILFGIDFVLIFSSRDQYQDLSWN